MSAARHQGFHHTGEANLVGSPLELVESLGIEIPGRAQPQLTAGQVADGAAVHVVVYGTCRRHHLDAQLLKLEQTLRADGLYLGHDDVGLVLPDHSLQRIAVEHGKNLTLIGHLHSRGIVVAVAGNDILAGPHGGNHKLLAQFA